jgi:hypothetical protein
MQTGIVTFHKRSTKPESNMSSIMSRQAPQMSARLGAAIRTTCATIVCERREMIGSASRFQL